MKYFRKSLFLAAALMATCSICTAQSIITQRTGISDNGTDPDESAILDLSTTDKGLLLPRMTTDQRNAIANPAVGLLVFDTDFNQFVYYLAGNWIPLGTAAVHWQENGERLYTNADSIGINTSEPLSPLHIMGSNTSSTLLLTPNEPSSAENAAIILAEDDDATYYMEMKYDGIDNRTYWYGHSNGTDYGPHMGINRNNGRVGIGTGTSDLNAELEVIGTIKADAFEGDGSGLIQVCADSLKGSMQADSSDLLQWNGTQWDKIPYGRYAFHASASSDQTVGDTAYDTLRCNNSSSGENFEDPAGIFDNSTFAFEAPVDGIYFFETAVLWDNPNLSEVRNAIFIRVNNTDEVGEWSVSGGTDFFGTGASTTVELNAGDEVRVRIYNGDDDPMDTFSQSGKYCYFSGFLIFAQ